MKIVRFTAMWCSSCLVMKKRWKNVFSNYPSIEIIDLDYDDDIEECKAYQVGSVLPVVIIFDDHGNELKRMIGEMKEKVLAEEMENLQ